MKRDDMLINVILKTIESHFVNVDTSAFPEYLLCSCAADVLDKIEEAGMLPPGVKTGASGWEISRGGMSPYKYEWEPEDV